MKPIVAVAVALAGCARVTAPPPPVSSPSEGLSGYAFAVCLAEGGAATEATAAAISFYREADTEEPWRYEQVAACAKTYVRSRGNTLGRNLVIPYCLEFLRSSQLAAASTGPRDEALRCADRAGPPRGLMAPPALE